MKICFIGLGSIGTRHINNISSILSERGLPFCIDALRSSNKELSQTVGFIINQAYYSIEDLPNDYDIIFITNPTHQHYGSIKSVASKTKHMFIEKPLFESCNYDLNALHRKTDGVYYVACPLRYSPVIKYLKKIIDEKNIYSVRAISSSYLPDWRGGVDYRNVYSAKKSQGGGVTLDLIHEWDYITYLFGTPIQVYNLNGTFSHLEIDSDDLSIYIAKYSDKLVELHLDYFGRETKRQLELFCEDCVIKADFIGMKIDYTGSIQETILLEKEDIYKNEMNYFLDMILNNAYNYNDIQHAYQVLSIATGEKI
jgi:predicted dehydrogenase